MLTLSFFHIVPGDIQPDKIRICFAGDMLLDRGIRKSIEQIGIDGLFSDIKPVWRNADYVVVNLECPVTKRNSPANKKFVFRAEPEWLPGLRNAGITHLVTANNHVIDHGIEGIRDTFRHIADNSLVPIGGNERGNLASKPVLLVKGKHHVAVWASVLLAVGSTPSAHGGGDMICRMSTSRICEDIRRSKAIFPGDKVVVILHWGQELTRVASGAQVKQAHDLIDAGADLIVGHHPHIAQKVSYYKGKPIFFSLGNFIFDRDDRPGRQSVMIQVDFFQETIGVREYILSFKNGAPRLIFNNP